MNWSHSQWYNTDGLNTVHQAGSVTLKTINGAFPPSSRAKGNKEFLFIIFFFKKFLIPNHLARIAKYFISHLENYKRSVPPKFKSNSLHRVSAVGVQLNKTRLSKWFALFSVLDFLRKDIMSSNSIDGNSLLIFEKKHGKLKIKIIS